MSRHKTGYIISYHGILCHNMSYVMTIAASLVWVCVHACVGVCECVCVCMCIHVCVCIYVFVTPCCIKLTCEIVLVCIFYVMSPN